MKKVVSLLLLLVAVVSLQAQTLSGTLKSAKGNEPIPFANVALMRAADTSFVRGVVTNDNGFFSLLADTSACLLRITVIGYETLFVTPPSNHCNLGTITLQEGATLLNEVSIVAERPLYSVDGEKDLYNVSEDASIQTGTASDALQNAPGVEVDVDGTVRLNGTTATVWINNRPSHLEGEPLKQYIKMLPANSIERIEVIKVPSAKYGGGNPVVNIITNQNLMKNSFVSFGCNGSSSPAITPWASYVYSNDKFHLSTYLNYSGKQYETASHNLGKLVDTAMAARHWTQESESQIRDNTLWGSINADYKFDAKNNISAYMGFYPSLNFNNTITRHTDTSFAPYEGLYNYYQESSQRATNAGCYFGTSFTHKFDNDDHYLMVSLSGNYWGYATQQEGFRNYTDRPWQNFTHKTSTDNLSRMAELEVNYTLPYSEQGAIEMGVSASLSRDHDFHLRDTLVGNEYRCDSLRTDYNYTPENTYSAFLSWERTWGNLKLKVGGTMRYSRSESNHTLVPEFDTMVTRLWVNPTLHLSYRTKNMHNLTFAYKVGKNRIPDASEVSRYIRYDLEDMETGNPYLVADMSHHADLSWNKYFEKFGSVGLSATYHSYQNSYNNIVDALYNPYVGYVVDFSKPYNNSDGYRLDLTLNCMYRPSSFFNVRLYAGFKDDYYSVVAREGVAPIEDRMQSWYVRGRVWAKVWNKVEIFANGYYNSRSHGWNVLSELHARKGVDLGMSADFFDRKLSLYLNANDIFNWNGWSYSSVNPYNTSTFSTTWTSRTITFGATLRLGKMELESRARTGATEKEIGG